MIFLFQYGILVYNSQLVSHQETNYENPAGNYFENEKSDSDDDMIPDVQWHYGSL